MDLKKIIKYILATMFLFSISACAIGNKYAMHSAHPNLHSKAEGEVGVAALDKRSFIVNSDKEPNFIGLQRGGYGNPFDVETQSGRPLSSDIVNALSKALQKTGFEAKPVYTDHSQTVLEVKNILMKKEADRLLLLTIYQWKSDTMVNVGLYYNLEIKVFSKEGKELAEKRIQGEDDLGGNFINPPSHATTVVPKALKEKLKVLLMSPEIKASLFQN